MSPAEPKVLTMADVADLHLETYVGEDAASVTVDVGDLRATVEALEQARAELEATDAIAKSRAMTVKLQTARIEALTKALRGCVAFMKRACDEGQLDFPDHHPDDCPEWPGGQCSRCAECTNADEFNTAIAQAEEVLR